MLIQLYCKEQKDVKNSFLFKITKIIVRSRKPLVLTGYTQ